METHLSNGFEREISTSCVSLCQFVHKKRHVAYGECLRVRSAISAKKIYLVNSKQLVLMIYI